MEKRVNDSFDSENNPFSSRYEKLFSDHIASLVSPTEEMFSTQSQEEFEGEGSNIESRLYAKGNYLYKVLFDEYRMERLPIIQDFIDKPIQYTPQIVKLLTDEDGIFIGYKMELLRDYVSLRRAYDLKITSDEKRNAAKQVLTSFKEFTDRGYRYWDVHWYNIMIKGSQGRLIDIDSASRLKAGNTIAYPLHSLMSYLTGYILGETRIDFEQLKVLRRELKNNQIALNCIERESRRVIKVEKFKDSVINFDLDSAHNAIDSIDDDVIKKVQRSKSLLRRLPWTQ